LPWSNVTGTAPSARFMPVADLDIHGTEFRILLHRATMLWDAHVLPLVQDVGKFGSAMEPSDLGITWHQNEKTNPTIALSASSTKIQRQMMMSYIPFRNPQPIVNIPHMHVTTALGTFSNSFES